MAEDTYVRCVECEGDGCHGPNPAEDICARCGGSGAEPVASDTHHVVAVAAINAKLAEMAGDPRLGRQPARQPGNAMTGQRPLIGTRVTVQSVTGGQRTGFVADYCKTDDRVRVMDVLEDLSGERWCWSEWVPPEAITDEREAG